MRRLFILLSVFAVGCGTGVQAVSSDAKWPGGAAKSDGFQTPGSASFSSEMTETSAFRTCQAQNEGLPNADVVCKNKVLAGMPGQLPVCGYGYAYSYVMYEVPGYNCRMPAPLVRAP